MDMTLWGTLFYPGQMVSLFQEDGAVYAQTLQVGKSLEVLGPGIEQNQREAKPDHGGERERNETPVMQARREREEQRPMLACEGGGFRIGEGDTGTNAGWSDGKEERRNIFQWILFSQLNRRSL